MESQGNIKLLIQNQEVFEIDKKITKFSVLLKDQVENFDTSQGIPLDEEKVDKNILNKIVDYCTVHEWTVPKPITKPLKSSKLEENLNPKDYQFIKNYQIFDDDTQALKKLANAADYLQIQSLFEVCVCKIATEFFCGDDQEGFESMKQKHNIKNDLTIEHEQELLKKYPFIEHSENKKQDAMVDEGEIQMFK